MGFGGRLTSLTAAAALLVTVAGCGSGSKSKSAAATPSTSSTSTSGGAHGGASVTTGPVHATFIASNHNPKISKPWPYSVHVTDSSGHALSGSVKIQFTFGGQVVGTDTPAVHTVMQGKWHDNLTFPRAAAGQPITLQAVVHTSAGSVTLNWPVTARQ
jgi:hypothetical protein